MGYFSRINSASLVALTFRNAILTSNRVPVVRIDSHRFENNFMNREAVRSGSVPLRFVSRPVHGFIRFHSVRFLSGIDCVIAFCKGSVCGNVYSSIQTISVGVHNFLKATLALRIA